MEDQHKHHRAPTPAPLYNTVNTPAGPTMSKSSSSHKLFLLWVIALTQIAILAVAVVILVYQIRLYKNVTSGYETNWFDNMNGFASNIQRYLSQVDNGVYQVKDVLYNGFKGNLR